MMDVEEQLARTVESLAGPLLRYCKGWSGDAARAEDAAQEALAALVQQWRRKGAPEDPEAFAFVVARRRLRRAQRWTHRWLPLASAPEPTGAPAAMERLEVAQAMEALTKLPEHEREALLLTAIAGVPGTTAAKLLGISLSALKMRVHRARQHLLEIHGERDEPRP